MSGESPGGRQDGPHREGFRSEGPRREPKADANKLLERQLPQSVEAEKAVLCSLLLLPETADEVALIIKPDDFLVDANRRIYGHLMTMRDDGAAIDVLLLIQRLKDSGDFDLMTVQANILGGPVEGKIALMFDDMISTAGSICGAAKVLHEKGVKEIHVGTTHAVLCGPAMERLREAQLASLVCTNSIPLTDEQILPQTQVLDVGPTLGEAIKRIHRNESVSKLFR